MYNYIITHTGENNEIPNTQSPMGNVPRNCCSDSVSPNEAVQNIQVMVTNVNNISTVIDIEGLEDLAEFGRELKERDIVGKLDNYLTSP